jgi:hypothetical protein
MSQRANNTQQAGLYTYISTTQAPEGSLEKADNINIDETGVITPRRGFNDYGSSIGTADDRVKQILSYKDKILRHFGTTLQFEDVNGAFQNFNGSYSEIEAGYRIKSKEYNGNLYFTTDSGIKKISAKTASDLSTSTGYITDAGAPKAIDLSVKLVPSLSGFLPKQSKVAYRMLFGYKDANNVLILGSPSSRVVITNTSKDLHTYESLRLTFKSPNLGSVFAGKYFIIYTKETKYYVWYNTGASEEPQTGDTLGGTGVEVSILAGDSHGIVANKTANALSSLDIFSEINITNPSDAVIDAVFNDTGDLTTPSIGSLTATEFAISTPREGVTTEGYSANTEISFIIPEGVVKNLYFYQIYRTAVISAIEGVDVNDLDPGEDYNLVYEETIVNDVGTLVTGVEDITNETFRASGTPLYTSKISGEGILQANEKPPIAKDMELFQGYTFYANTKTLHRLQFSILSVDNFQDNGATEFIVGNSTKTRIYKFRGNPETSTITCGDKANTLETNANNSKITLYSANNERTYYLWFDKGTGVDPQIAGQQGLRIDLTEASVSTSTDVATKIKEVLDEIDDFTVTQLANVLTILNTNNGHATDIATPTGVETTDIGTGWDVAVTTQGLGEESANNFVLKSGLTSVSLSIDETARSLVRIINQDVNSPVNAFYLSGADDLPGQILLENKSLADDPFYLSIYDNLDSDIGKEFNPELPLKEESITVSSYLTTKTKITKTAHGLLSGDYIYFYCEFDPTPIKRGYYQVTVINANEFSIDVNINTLTVDLTPTLDNPFYFKATQASDNEKIGNRIYYSKYGQPEAVPLPNYIDIAGKDSEIERIVALRDNLFVFKTDGIYILSGFSAPFSVRLLDNTAFLVAPDTATVLNNQIYGLTNQGIVTVTETSPTIISRSIENKILDVVNDRYDYRLISFGVSYENDRAYIIWLPTKVDDEVATQAYRYNNFERTWTRWTYSATCGFVKPRENKLYIGDGTRNYLMQERKTRDRTDYSDRNFTLQIPDDALIEDTIRLTTVVDVTAGDVLLQEQAVTISRYNRLLRKLDTDGGLNLSVTSAPYLTTKTKITLTGHGLTTGNSVRYSATKTLPIPVSGIDSSFTVTVIDANEFYIDLDTTGYTLTGEQIHYDYETNLLAIAGDSMMQKLSALNARLVIDDTSSTITTYPWSDTNLVLQLASFDSLIDNLNDNACDTLLKTYTTIQATTLYEAVIISVNGVENIVTVQQNAPFVQGNIEIYKGYERNVQWNPMTFGDPSALKQMRESTLIFDNNTVSTAFVAYSTDLSPSFEEVDLTGNESGYWGYGEWGSETMYWGGDGNDAPFRRVIPREKQRGRYLSVRFRHLNAREPWRLLGCTAVVRAISSKGYKK